MNNEDIKVLEEILNRQIEDTEGTKIMKRAIENLIKGYKELEEKNNEYINNINKLQKECNEENKRCVELSIELKEEQISHKNDSDCLMEVNECLTKDLEESIPKSKLQEKIEELDRIIEPKQNRHQFLCIEVNKVGSETEIDNIAEELSMLDDELKELLIERRTYKQLLQEGDK